MKALLLNRYGGPDATELRTDVAPPPAPGPGMVRVRVRAAGLNPVDFKTRDGKLKAILKFRLPVVMGNEIAGEVESIGAGVTRLAVGQRVFARLDKGAMGGLAELALVHADHVAAMPSSLDFEHAAAVPLAGLTALQALRDVLRLRPGQRVFVSAGAGGVGTFAIQLAKRRFGAFVATTASPRGDALVRRLGADAVVDYTRERFDEALPHDFDGAFDLIGGADLRRALDVVERGATVVSIADVPEPDTARLDLGRGGWLAAAFWALSLRVRRAAARRGVRYRFLFMHPSGADLAELAESIDGGQLEVIVDRVFALDDAKAALAYLESGRAKGKVVVRID